MCNVTEQAGGGGISFHLFKGLSLDPQLTKRQACIIHHIALVDKSFSERQRNLFAHCLRKAPFCFYTKLVCVLMHM